MEEAAARLVRADGAIMAVESLGGKEIQYFFHSYNEGVEELSPTDRLFITQVGLEPLLRDRAAALGAEHRFGTALVSLHSDSGVPIAVQPLDGNTQWQGASLVRPDGVVAWRSADTSATSGLSTVLGEIMSRT